MLRNIYQGSVQVLIVALICVAYAQCFYSVAAMSL